MNILLGLPLSTFGNIKLNISMLIQMIKIQLLENGIHKFINVNSVKLKRAIGIVFRKRIFSVDSALNKPTKVEIE